MDKYTNNGRDFYYAGDRVGKYMCVTASWLTANGYMPYMEVAEDGEDGIKDGHWVHYTGAPYVAPEPVPYVPTEEEKAQQAEAARKAGIEAQIEMEKAAIADTDYIIVKCAEAQLIGEDSPYDADYLEGIHIARQAHRDRINALQASLSCDQSQDNTNPVSSDQSLD